MVANRRTAPVINKNLNASYLLGACEFGRALDGNELELILRYCTLVEFDTGEHITQQGKKAEGIFILIEGEVNITGRIMGNGVTHIESLGVGNIVGGGSFIINGLCTTSAVAKSKVTCLLINRPFFELLGSFYPETKYKIIKRIAEQACVRIKRMHDKVTGSILDSGMHNLSSFGRVIHSFIPPKQVLFSERGIMHSQLQNKTILQSFTTDELETLLGHVVCLEAPKNCILIQEGETKAICYLVIQGAVQSSIMKDNKIAKLSVIGPGSLFANIACLGNHSAFTITFMTCETAVLININQKALRFFQQHHPKLWYKLFNLICESLIALGKSIDKLDIRLQNENYNR